MRLTTSVIPVSRRSSPIRCRRRAFAWIASGIGLLIGGARDAHGQSACQVPPDAIATIDSVDADWLPAMRHRDAARIVAPYDSAGVFVKADGASIRGRDSITALYKSRVSGLAHVYGGGIVREGACAAGDSLVYEWGHGQLEFADSAGTKHRSTSRYLTVWRRTMSGAWMIVRNLVL